MPLRIREIADGLGASLRVTAERHHPESLVILERGDMHVAPPALLDHYGAEVLRAFLMAARLSLAGGLPDEMVDGPFATQFRLNVDPVASLALTQDCGLTSLDIPATLWDRLYAELCLISAHHADSRHRGGRRAH